MDSLLEINDLLNSFSPKEMTWTGGENLYHYKQDAETTAEPLTDEVFARFDGIGLGGIARQLADDKETNDGKSEG